MAGRSRTRVWVVVVSGMLAVTALAAPSLAGAAVKDVGGLYVPKPDQGARAQIGALRDAGDMDDAALIQSMVETPQAVWLTKGTPKQVEQSVRTTLKQAKGSLVVLVAYNIPGRDCANLSAGGAISTAEYEAWIDGLANGIGDSEASVILEPDGLGLLPGSNCGGPKDGYPFTDAERYLEINYAVDALAALPNTKVYLDATHSAWQNVGDATNRLIAAGVARAQGFFLNVSNFQFAPNQVQYGTWISKCITRRTTNPVAECPDQYWNGGPLPSLIAQTIGEWTGDALNRYGIWSDTDTTVVSTVNGPRMPLNTSAINLRYADTTGTIPFVIDTSRNGVGPWQYLTSTYANDGAALDWCNPPGRGLGPRPTINTGVPLVDAYLWIKTPGQSDGTCNRNGTAVGSPDPEWAGIVDPAAGQWFPQQALQLAQLANPPLLP